MQKNLTIIAVDTAYPTLTKKAVEKAVEITGSDKVTILSDTDIVPGSRWVKIDPISYKEYNKIVFNDLAQYIDTDHFMIVQYDGMPIDSTKWDDDYLNYDYIGAVWPWHPEGKNVGNGGFSIRSRRLAEACTDLMFNPPELKEPIFSEDEHICHIYRNVLESRGIRFAPSQLARKFSAEIPGGRFDTYGFHGTLCLPHYLDDDHMKLYIDNLTSGMLKSPSQIRIALGLYYAQRYDLLEYMMDRAVEIDGNFKNVLLDQVPTDLQYFPGLTLAEVSELLINY
jgi:hypothetical protein